MRPTIFDCFLFFFSQYRILISKQPLFLSKRCVVKTANVGLFLTSFSFQIAVLCSTASGSPFPSSCFVIRCNKRVSWFVVRVVSITNKFSAKPYMISLFFLPRTATHQRNQLGHHFVWCPIFDCNFPQVWTCTSFLAY